MSSPERPTLTVIEGGHGVQLDGPPTTAELIEALDPANGPLGEHPAVKRLIAHRKAEEAARRPRLVR